MTLPAGGLLRRLSAAQLLLAAWAVPSVDKVQVDPATGHFRDAHGRVRIFHGVNVVYKVPPWLPTSEKFDPNDSLDTKTMDLLRQWGFNVVRLGVMWPGVEPKQGVIDSAYMGAISHLADELAKRGVYTIADLHQDLGSRRFCGEGFPEYYVDAMERDPSSPLSKAPAWPAPLPYSFPNATGGVPAMEDCLKHDFGKYYLTDRVGAMWRELYTSGTALREGFLRYWKAVATALGGRPHVLGYELLNEPSGFCLGEGVFSCKDAAKTLGNFVESRYLIPLYQEAAKTIRAVDKTTPLFYEATVTPKLKDPFPDPALGNETQQVLAYHVYCLPGDGDSRMSGLICEASQDTYTRLYFGFLRKHRGLGGFLTEFGAIGGKNEGELRHLERLLGLADTMFQSWTYWMLKLYRDFTTANAAQSLFDADGKVETPKLAALSRTYAPAIGGTPRAMVFDAATGAFELRFVTEVVDAPTEVYLNAALNYPDGFHAEASPAECFRQSSTEQNYLSFHLADGAACLGKEATIRITRAAAAEAAPPALVV